MNTQPADSPSTTRADVLRLTWQLVKNARLSFGKALKKAWATVKLRAKMLTGPAEFAYVKDDGSTRYAVGHYAAATPTTGTGKPSSPLAVRYFDMLADGWRSFRIDRLITE